jgi:hypothetical protein
VLSNFINLCVNTRGWSKLKKKLTFNISTGCVNFFWFFSVPLVLALVFASMTTHVKVAHSTMELLKNLKISGGHKSVDAVIISLINGGVESGEESPSSLSDVDGEPEENRRRKRNVREPLFSWEVLLERHEMLEYYTGFNKDDVKVLIDRLEEVRVEDFLFFFSEAGDFQCFEEFIVMIYCR